jgi:hypothetical protein
MNKNGEVMMKKVIIFCVLVLMVVFFHGGAEEESPDLDNMASFMGMKWGVSAADFQQSFKHKDKLKARKNFCLENFELGGVTLAAIEFDFKPEDEKQKLKFKNENYNHLFLEGVIIHSDPNHYDFLFDVFSIKYGPPQIYEEYQVLDIVGSKFLQKVAVWGNPKMKRMIVFYRFTDTIEKGIAYFIPYEEKMMRTRSERARIAAEEL